MFVPMPKFAGCWRNGGTMKWIFMGKSSRKETENGNGKKRKAPQLVLMRGKRSLRCAADQFWKLLYPARCAVCDEVLSGKTSLICPTCRGQIRTVGERYCITCGKPLHEGQDAYCFDCASVKHCFTRGRSVFCYEDIRESVYRFKYEGRQEYASYYAEEAVRVLGEDIKSWHAQALIPIPLHKDKLRKRGYNQAALFAEELSTRLGIPVLDKVLVRERNTAPQKGLNREERQKNLKKAFKFVQNDVKLKTIILIDDIYTTGSTADAAGDVLRQSGIKNIYVVTLASGNGI